MEEHTWEVGDRVTHREHLRDMGILLRQIPGRTGFWVVLLDVNVVVNWHAENLLPEPPLEALARVAQESNEAPDDE